MRKAIFSTLLMLLVATSAVAQIKVVDNSLRKSTSAVKPQWPDYDADGNENPRQILLRVLYESFPQDAIDRISFSTHPSTINKIQHIKDDKTTVETHLFLPIITENVTFTHPDYGVCRINLPQNLSDKDVYQMQLSIDIKVNLDVEPYTDNSGVVVELDNNQSKTTPARFYDVSVGQHKLVFGLGDKQITRIVDVTPKNHIFTGANPDFDFRTKKTIKITTKPSGAKIYVDSKDSGLSTPSDIVLPYGTHTLSVVHNDIATDEISLNVNDDTPSEIIMHPQQRVSFKVAGKYKGSPIVGNLYVDGMPAYKFTVDSQDVKQENYTFYMPVGQKHSYKMTYHGNEGNANIKTTKNMPSVMYIDIKDRRRLTWPWEKPYEASPLAFTAGYVQKQMVTKMALGDESETLKENGVWDDGEDSYLHGLQIGMQYDAALRWGLGFHTGLFYEYYKSKNTDAEKEIYDEENGVVYFSHPKYEEHGLYVPVHMFFRLPLAQKLSLAFGGGLGFGYSLKARYYGKKGVFGGMEGEYMPIESFHGDDFYPKRFNMTADASINFRLGLFMITAQMGWGLNDHKSYKIFQQENPELKTKTVVNHNSLSISYLF